jgi:hypothetical protein
MLMVESEVEDGSVLIHNLFSTSKATLITDECVGIVCCHDSVASSFNLSISTTGTL